MQRVTLEELKHILYHAFRDHLTMKDIENIIINEEESLNETSGNCQTEFEGVSQACIDSYHRLSPASSRTEYMKAFGSLGSLRSKALPESEQTYHGADKDSVHPGRQRRELAVLTELSLVIACDSASTSYWIKGRSNDNDPLINVQNGDNILVNLSFDEYEMSFSISFD
ncbi:hypothetical protein STEG23_017970 [Scotinomys teguina]